MTRGVGVLMLEMKKSRSWIQYVYGDEVALVGSHWRGDSSNWWERNQCLECWNLDHTRVDTPLSKERRGKT